MSKNNFNVNTEIYPVKYITQAIDAFEGYAITYEPVGCVLCIDDDNPQFVFDELMNYTLSLILE